MSPPPQSDEWVEYSEDEYGGDYGGGEAGSNGPEELGGEDGYGEEEGGDYGEEDYDSEGEFSEDSDDDLPCRAWPDIFDEGTEVSSSPSRQTPACRSPSLSAASGTRSQGSSPRPCGTSPGGEELVVELPGEGASLQAAQPVQPAACRLSPRPWGRHHQHQLMPGRSLITIWDLDPACNRKRQRGDVRLMSEPKTSSTDSHLPRRGRHHSAGKSQDELGSPQGTVSPRTEDSMLCSGTNPSTTLNPSRCSQELQSLRLCLRIKCGSTVAAWRALLDPKMQGSVSFGKFILVLEDCGFQGNVKGLWEELAGSRPGITLKDIDAEACRHLDRFRDELLNKFGCLSSAWEELDADAAGRLDEEEFISACSRLALAIKSPKKAFQLLRARLGQRSLTLEDLVTLLIGVPAAERAEVWVRTGGAGTEEGPPGDIDEGTAEPLSPGGAARPADQQPWLPKEDCTSPRLHVEKAAKEHSDKSSKFTTLDGFRRILTRRHGSLFAAWRHCLDVDQNGVVTQQDFAAACRGLGVKNVQQLWTELDENRDGQISLKELDPETAELFGKLEGLLLERFGSTREAWRKVFLHTGSSWCEQETFLEQCKVLGFDGDAERLFHLVKPEVGRRYLTYEDLWLNLDPNFNQPESPMDWWMRPTHKEAT